LAIFTRGKTFNLTANIDLNPGWNATFEFGDKEYTVNNAQVEQLAILS
jgi:hypothetical protein